MNEIEDQVNVVQRRALLRVKANEVEPDLLDWQRKLGWIPLDLVKRTKAYTTQYASHAYMGDLKNWGKSKFPMFNVKRLMEKYATDTWYASEKDISGATCVQIFSGMKSYYTYIEGMIMLS